MFNGSSALEPSFVRRVKIFALNFSCFKRIDDFRNKQNFSSMELEPFIAIKHSRTSGASSEGLKIINVYDNKTVGCFQVRFICLQL